MTDEWITNRNIHEFQAAAGKAFMGEAGREPRLPMGLTTGACELGVGLALHDPIWEPRPWDRVPMITHPTGV